MPTHYDFTKVSFKAELMRLLEDPISTDLFAEPYLLPNGHTLSETTLEELHREDHYFYPSADEKLPDILPFNAKVAMIVECLSLAEKDVLSDEALLDILGTRLNEMPVESEPDVVIASIRELMQAYQKHLGLDIEPRGAGRLISPEPKFWIRPQPIAPHARSNEVVLHLKLNKQEDGNDRLVLTFNNKLERDAFTRMLEMELPSPIEPREDAKLTSIAPELQFEIQSTLTHEGGRLIIFPSPEKRDLFCHAITLVDGDCELLGGRDKRRANLLAITNVKDGLLFGDPVIRRLNTELFHDLQGRGAIQPDVVHTMEELAYNLTSLNRQIGEYLKAHPGKKDPALSLLSGFEEQIKGFLNGYIDNDVMFNFIEKSMENSCFQPKRGPFFGLFSSSKNPNPNSDIKAFFEQAKKTISFFQDVDTGRHIL